MSKNNDCDVDTAQYRQLVRFLEQATFALQESPVTLISLE